MSKKKLLKPILFGVTGFSLVSLVLGLSINWSHTQYLQAVGSSGVKPFITALGTQYHNTHSKFDVAVESGGTTFAVEQIAKGYAQLGNASNNPYYTIFPNKGTGEYSSKWGGKKTLTLGWEGIFIMYKMPDGLSPDAQKNFDIWITKDNILDLYAVFSGFNESLINGAAVAWTDEEITLKNSLYHYLSPTSKAWFDKEENKTQKELIFKTPITPFLRSGGNTGANSSIAFTYYSNLADFNQMTLRQRNAFKGGQYGPAHKFYETEESNAQCWQSFTSYNLPCSMTYMSSGFLAFEGNRKLMKEYGYRVAKYVPKDSDQPVELISDDYSQIYLNNICKLNGYNWYRPINVMIDLSVEKSKNFIYWVFTGKEKEEVVTEYNPEVGPLKNIMEKNGAKVINQLQFETMLTPASNDLGIYDRMFNSDASDIKLSESRTETEDKETFGAVDEKGVE